MKRLMTYMLIALMSLGVASVTLAEEGAAGGQPASGEMQHGKAEKKHKKKHSKKGKKDKKSKDAPAEEMK